MGGLGPMSKCYLARASISQDYWGDIKEDWGSGDGSL